MKCSRTSFYVRLVCCLLFLPILTIQAQTVLSQQADAPDWWKHAVIYEIYPRSFQDSNGDGTGDLKGITQRLDYLRDLGVNTIWLSPMFPSPQVDFGYDISNYEAIDPQYGTMADFEELVRESRKRNIKVILDAVMNHTSDQHPWFIESKSSKTSPKRNWYIWTDGRNGGPPNNWTSGFGGSAWEYDPATKQYYYHNFYKEQPDLNWRNPEVVAAMKSMLRFWLNKGVSGFRLDAILILFEDPSLKDAPVLPGKTPHGDIRIDRSQLNNLPEVHGILRQLRELVDEYPNHPVLIGEDYLPTPEKLRELYGKNHDELQLPMDMQLGFINELNVDKFGHAIEDAATKLDGNQPLFVFDNHDRPRSWDRYGDGKNNDAIARVIASVLLTTRATPLLYQGQELGMKTVPPARREDVQDPIGKTGWPVVKGRDGERTPMQWDASKNAGFSSASRTWLPVEDNFKTVNVALERKDPHSLLNWYKDLIKARDTNVALRDGDTQVLRNNPEVLAYMRSTGKSRVLVLCNFAAREVEYRLPDANSAGASMLATEGASRTNSSTVHLPAFGVWIGQIENAESK